MRRGGPERESRFSRELGPWLRVKRSCGCSVALGGNGGLHRDSHVSQRRDLGHLQPFHPADESIAAARQSLDITRPLGRVAQCVAEFVYGGAEAVVEVDKSVGGPKTAAHLVARDKFAGAV